MSNVINAVDLDIHLAKDDNHELFKWLIASFLMGKRIQAPIAAEAYRVIVRTHRRDTPGKLATCAHRDLVKMLGEAHYTRYDESTAERLRALAQRLIEEYGGKMTHIRDASDGAADFKERLKAFDGIGPKTVEIFMRDARPVLF